MDTPELGVIGLTCNVVGVFFLANSIRLRDPRKAIEEGLGVAPRSLDKVRDTALNNMQVLIGFLFLTAGFLLQIMGRWDGQLFTLACCGGIIAFAALVYAIGAYSSRRTFKKLLREFFRSQPYSFTDNMALTKEIGEVLGVPRSTETTVEDYVYQVQKALGVTPLPPKTERTADRNSRIRNITPLPGR